MEGPLRATIEDFDSLIECVDECFPRDRERGGMLPRWPHCYIRSPEILKNCLIMKDGDRVVSHVEYVDQTLQVGNANIKVAGISGVATLLSYRGQGLMTKLLNHSISLMEEEGYVFSELGGNTQRYRRFGWENGGRAWVFDINHGSCSEVALPVGWKVRTYVGTVEDLALVQALHDQEPMGVVRTPKMYPALLSRLGHEAYLATGPGGETAYLVANIDDRQHQRIMEFGGAGEGVHVLLGYLLGEGGAESLTVSSPWSHPVNPTFFKLSVGWHVRCLRMIRIVDLAGALQGFSGQLKARYAQRGLEGDREFSLALADTDQQATLRFSHKGVTVEEGVSKQALTLGRLEMVRFLFGPGSPAQVVELPPEAKFLEALLPLDFYVWANESV